MLYCVIERAKALFLEKGGIKEEMYRARLAVRNTQSYQRYQSHQSPQQEFQNTSYQSHQSPRHGIQNISYQSHQSPRQDLQNTSYQSYQRHQSSPDKTESSNNSNSSDNTLPPREI